jgi:hypothetical protein
MRSPLLAVLALALSASPALASPFEDYAALREDIWQERLDDQPVLLENGPIPLIVLQDQMDRRIAEQEHRAQ